MGSGRPPTELPHLPPLGHDYVRPGQATAGRCEGSGRPPTELSPFPVLLGGVYLLHLQPPLGVFKGWMSMGSGRPPTELPHLPPLSHGFVRPGQGTTGRCEGIGRPLTDPLSFPAQGDLLASLGLSRLGSMPKGRASKGSGRPPTEPPRPPPPSHDFVRPGQGTTGRCEGSGRPSTDPRPSRRQLEEYAYFACYPSIWACQ